jgi:hypothetical protein
MGTCASFWTRSDAGANSLLLSWMRIPMKPAIDSDRNQPPVPIEASRAFRRKPAGVAVWSEGGNIRLRSQSSRQA